MVVSYAGKVRITVLSAYKGEAFSRFVRIFLDHSLQSFCFSKQYPI